MYVRFLPKSFHNSFRRWSMNIPYFFLCITQALAFSPRAGRPSRWQPALAPELLGFPALDYQIAAQLPCPEPFRQNELANPRLRNTEHPRDLCCGQRIDAGNARSWPWL